MIPTTYLKQIKTFIVRPALLGIGMYSLPAENLVTGTGLVESGFEALRQVDGPAESWFQIEPATEKDIQSRLSPFLKCALKNLGSCGQLVGYPMYAAAICRMKYKDAPEPLPAKDDYEGMANYWKAHYNTDKGKGTVTPEIVNLFKIASLA